MMTIFQDRFSSWFFLEDDSGSSAIFLLIYIQCFQCMDKPFKKQGMPESSGGKESDEHKRDHKNFK